MWARHPGAARALPFPSLPTGEPCPALPPRAPRRPRCLIPPLQQLLPPHPASPAPGPSRRVSAEEAGSDRRSGTYTAPFPPRFVTLEFPFRGLGGGNGRAAPPLSPSGMWVLRGVCGRRASPLSGARPGRAHSALRLPPVGSGGRDTKGPGRVPRAAGSVPESGGGRDVMSSPGGQRGRGAPRQRLRDGLGAGGAGAPLPPSLPRSLNLARPRGAPGEVRGGWRGSPPRSAPPASHGAGGGRGEPPPSSRFSYSFFQSQRSTPARLERGAGLGRAGSAACSRGAAPQRRRRGSGTSARCLRCIPASDAPSRLHASPAAAAPGGCGSSSSL